ncbi:MAG: hypothetical protein EZS28_048588, partial [Streblomastix strix]
MIGAKEVMEIGAQLMWKHKGSQRKLERLCKVTREESSMEGKVHFRDILEKELSGGVVKEVDSKETRHFNLSYMAPKKGGKWMKVLDSRKLNEEIVKTHFKMEEVRQVVKSMQKRDFATILDLKSAYHHDKVEKSLSPYMGLSFDNRSFMYVGMSFGWT